MLFKKLFLFAVLLVAIQLLVSFAFVNRALPQFWGNEEIYTKLKYVNDHPGINTVFVGSSKIKTQVDPATFDSVTGGKTHSFNLGCNGLFIPESFNILNYLVDSTAIKNIFFDFRPVYHIYKENLHITRTTYYHTLNSYLQTMQNVYHSNLPAVRKANAYSTFTIAATERLLNFNLAEGVINYRNFEVDKLTGMYDKNGGCFFMGIGPGAELLQSHAELDNRAAVSVNYMQQYKTDSLKNLQYNVTYYNQMKEIMERAAAKNKTIVLLFPSALREFEYKEILPLMRQLPSTALKFIVTDAAEYPELYTVENNFETEHLNAKGSLVYSKILGEMYNKAMKH